MHVHARAPPPHTHARTKTHTCTHAHTPSEHWHTHNLKASTLLHWGRWENFELISDRPFETMLAELKRLKEEFPDRILIASIMEEYNKGAWEEIVAR